MSAPSVTLVLGGARSGKSVFAEQCVMAAGKDKIYVATAQPFDSEMRARIDAHRARRGREWRTVDAPLELVDVLRANVSGTAVVLVDCLTLWLSNLLLANIDPDEAVDTLAADLGTLKGAVVMVSNEVGFGIVPENALARRFRDAQGQLNQRMAAVADEVYLVAAGLPLKLKPSAYT